VCTSQDGGYHLNACSPRIKSIGKVALLLLFTFVVPSVLMEPMVKMGGDNVCMKLMAGTVFVYSLDLWVVFWHTLCCQGSLPYQKASGAGRCMSSELIDRIINTKLEELQNSQPPNNNQESSQ